MASLAAASLAQVELEVIALSACQPAAMQLLTCPVEQQGSELLVPITLPARITSKRAAARTRLGQQTTETVTKSEIWAKNDFNYT